MFASLHWKKYEICGKNLKILQKMWSSDNQSKKIGSIIWFIKCVCDFDNSRWNSLHVDTVIFVQCGCGTQIEWLFPANKQTIIIHQCQMVKFYIQLDWVKPLNHIALTWVDCCVSKWYGALKPRIGRKSVTLVDEIDDGAHVTRSFETHNQIHISHVQRAGWSERRNVLDVRISLNVDS